MKQKILTQLTNKRQHFIQVFDKYKSNNCTDDPQFCFEMRSKIGGIIQGLDEAIYIVQQTKENNK